ncbi:MAG: hypothetical protein IJE10_11175 [Clostridia bacterium]|nr:hypothetical protein [Clostridia bacterium]
MDIRFYDFDLNLLHILPQWSYKIGYTSCNVQQDFNGNGSFEIVFADEILKTVVEQNQNELFVKWGDFQGFLTGYQWSDTECHLYGMHLNGLLKNYVVPADEAEGEKNAEQLILSTVNIVNTDAPWLTMPAEQGFTETISYPKNNYTPLDAWLTELLNQFGWGYEIKIDFESKVFSFALKKPSENGLMLSTNNLNAHTFVTTYDNKTLARGGWYVVDVEKVRKKVDEEGNVVEDETGQPIMETVTEKEWRYISNGAHGLHRRDVVLTATTDKEALNELKTFTATADVTCETESIQCGVDYNIGDIIRVQNGVGVTVKKLVSAVNWWQEQSYNEKPILTEVVLDD